MLVLNNQKYSKLKLLTLSNQTYDTNWQQSFWNFIKTWLDENEYVEVKTSGSTGTPKIIRLEKKRMIASAKATGDFFDLKPNDKALLCLPCDYIAGKMMVVRAMVLGLNLYSVEPTGNPLEKVENEGFQFGAMIPLQVLNSLKNNRSQFENIEKMIIGGGVVDSSLLNKLQSVQNQCSATYGMTETITHVAVKTLNGEQKSNVYQALKNVKFSQDNRNCLIINAPYLSENQIITNDIIKLHSKSSFEWLGRFDNVINTGGIKVNPEQIEQKIESFIETDFFIASANDEKLGSKVILVIENEGKINLDLLKKQFQTVLSKFEMPKLIYVLPQFKRTETGKIQRKRTIKNINY
ncbi:MAG: AMP-binding protein [Saprospiraceae bacterium]